MSSVRLPAMLDSLPPSDHPAAWLQLLDASSAFDSALMPLMGVFGSGSAAAESSAAARALGSGSDFAETGSRLGSRWRASAAEGGGGETEGGAAVPAVVEEGGVVAMLGREAGVMSALAVAIKSEAMEQVGLGWMLKMQGKRGELNRCDNHDLCHDLHH